MPSRYRRSKSHVVAESGVAAVEAAIVFPFFIFLFFSVVEFAPILLTYLKITQLAHEGTRALATEAELDSTGASFDYSTFDLSPAAVASLLDSTDPSGKTIKKDSAGRPMTPEPIPGHSGTATGIEYDQPNAGGYGYGYGFGYGREEATDTTAMTSGTVPPKHLSIHRRIALLLLLQGVQELVEDNQLTVYTRYDSASGIVEFGLRASSKGFFEIMHFPTVVRERGPYLFN